MILQFFIPKNAIFYAHGDVKTPYMSIKAKNTESFACLPPANPLYPRA